MRTRMQMLQVHDRVPLSRRLSQVANSCSRDGDLFYALPGWRGEAIIAKEGNRQRIGGPARARGRKGMEAVRRLARGPVALFTIATGHWWGSP